MKLIVIIVTYNRKEELLKTLASLTHQTLLPDTILIIDNHGTDGTREALQGAGYLLDKKATSIRNKKNKKIIEYIYLKDNYGGAGGFCFGVKKAYQMGADYLCLMDDDGRFADEKGLEILVNAAGQAYDKHPLLMLNSLVESFDQKELSFGLTKISSLGEAKKATRDGRIKDTINPFNGTLISKELVQKIGYPDRRFFIKGDEEDYQRRAKKAGALIATVTDSIFCHPSPPKRELSFSFPRIRFFRKSLETSRSQFTIKETLEAPWKEYYRARNLTYLFRREHQNRLWIKHILRQSLLALCYSKEKTKTIRYLFIGCLHGLIGKLGRTIHPGE